MGKTLKKRSKKAGGQAEKVLPPAGARPALGSSARVLLWRDALSLGTKPIDALEAAWQSLDKTGHEAKGYHREAIDGVDAPAVLHLRAYLNESLYPPPELLLALLESIDAYLKAGGSLSLEQALFGHKGRGPGPAKRYAAKQRIATWAFRFEELLQSGHSPESAGDAVAVEVGKGVNGESVRRMINRDFPHLRQTRLQRQKSLIDPPDETPRTK